MICLKVLESLKGNIIIIEINLEVKFVIYFFVIVKVRVRENGISTCYRKSWLINRMG